MFDLFAGAPSRRTMCRPRSFRPTSRSGIAVPMSWPGRAAATLEPPSTTRGHGPGHERVVTDAPTPESKDLVTGSMNHRSASLETPSTWRARARLRVRRFRRGRPVQDYQI